VDLTSGKEQALFDAKLPSVSRNASLASVDSSGALMIRDASGKTIKTLPLKEKLTSAPFLSPTGDRFVACVERPASQMIGSTKITLGEMLVTAVFDLDGKELASFEQFEDPAWTPDGKIVAVKGVSGTGLFLLDPATKQATPIDATIEH